MKLTRYLRALVAGIFAAFASGVRFIAPARPISLRNSRPPSSTDWIPGGDFAGMTKTRMRLVGDGGPRACRTVRRKATLRHSLRYPVKPPRLPRHAIPIIGTDLPL